MVAPCLTVSGARGPRYPRGPTRRTWPPLTAPIRILRVIARMNIGGPALQVTALQRGLDPVEFPSLLLSGSIGEEEGDHLAVSSPDIPVERIDGLGRAVRPADDVRALVAIRRYIREFDPHIVHTHTAKAGALGRVAAALAGVPRVVHTFHGHVLGGYFSPPVEAMVRWMERGLARRTTRILAVGARVREELLAAGVGRPEQYLVVPPGIPVVESVGRSAARAALDIPREADVIGFVGRLTAIKRPERLLDVLALVRRERHTACLVVAGEGEQLGSLRERAERERLPVTFLGWRADVGIVHSACDLQLLVSDNEWMPVALIEAAMVGRPAVTTDVGSASEVVLDGRTGFVTGRTAGELARAVIELLRDPGRREEMGQRAAVRARELFSEARLVGDMERLYRELVEDGPCRGRKSMSSPRGAG